MNGDIRVLLADPPWSFGDKLPGATRGAERNYSVMGVDALCGFPLPALADDALLFMWKVASQPEEAMRVVRAWDFVPKSEIVWVKTARAPLPALAFGMGRYVRGCHEVCVVAARGRGTRLIRNKSVRSVFFAPRGDHSVKPDMFYDLVESLAEGPYCELFARRTRPGWKQYGNELPGGLPEPERAAPGIA
jgi:N6-adenosine-specific RNA methylase IME4